MRKLINQFKSAAHKRALYTATRDEIAQMPRQIALDLGIYPGDAEKIARKAVWG